MVKWLSQTTWPWKLGNGSLSFYLNIIYSKKNITPTIHKYILRKSDSLSEWKKVCEKNISKGCILHNHTVQRTDSIKVTQSTCICKHLNIVKHSFISKQFNKQVAERTFKKQVYDHKMSSQIIHRTYYMNI